MYTIQNTTLKHLSTEHNWGERSESLPSDERRDFVCLSVCLSVCHGPARYSFFVLVTLYQPLRESMRMGTMKLSKTHAGLQPAGTSKQLDLWWGPCEAQLA